MRSKGLDKLGFHYLWSIRVEKSNKKLVAMREVCTKHLSWSIISI